MMLASASAPITTSADDIVSLPPIVVDVDNIIHPASAGRWSRASWPFRLQSSTKNPDLTHQPAQETLHRSNRNFPYLQRHTRLQPTQWWHGRPGQALLRWGPAADLPSRRRLPGRIHLRPHSVWPAQRILRALDLPRLVFRGVHGLYHGLCLGP